MGLLHVHILHSRAPSSSSSSLPSTLRPLSHPHRHCSPIARSSNRPHDNGDPALQQTLVDIARLQADKVRVSEFVLERSKHLSDIAQQAMVEYDRISEDAKRGIDLAGSKAMKTVEEDALEFEAQLASARAEMEAREEDFEKFEKKVEIARSEGLFFKGLYKPFRRWEDRAPQEQQAIKDEARNITEVTRKALGSKARRNLYVLLIFLSSLALLEAFGSPEISWSRLAIYGLVIALLILQLAFDNFASSNTDDGERG